MGCDTFKGCWTRGFVAFLILKYILVSAERVQNGEYVYVHCKAGRGRSTTLVVCYLIRTFDMDPVTAYMHVRQRRPQVSWLQSSFSTLLHGGSLKSLT
jgi:protein-tyrosine phosphatase